MNEWAFQNERIENVGQVEAGTKVAIPTFDGSIYELGVEIERNEHWNPLPSGSGAVYDDQDLIGLSASKKKLLNLLGEGTLFDPVLYVYSRHDPSNLMHMTTEINPFTGKPEKAKVVSVATMTEDPTGEGEGEVIPARYMVLFRETKGYFPYVVGAINDEDPINKNRWRIQFKLVSRRPKSEFAKIGEYIPGTRYLVEDIKVDFNDRSNAKTVIIKDGENTVELPGNGKRVVHGESTYIFKMVNGNGRPTPIRGSKGNAFDAVYADRQGKRHAARYMIVRDATEEGIQIVEILEDGRPDPNRVFLIPRE